MRIRTRGRLVPFAGLVVAVALMAGGCQQGSVQYSCTDQFCAFSANRTVGGCFNEAESSIDEIEAEFRSSCENVAPILCDNAGGAACMIKCEVVRKDPDRCAIIIQIPREAKP